MLRRVALGIGLVALVAIVASVVRFGPASITKWRRSVTEEKTTLAPKALVEGDLTHEFGTMPQEATGRWSWVVRNVGAADLELWLETSSYNTRPINNFKDGGKVILKPGESTKIELEWKTKRVVGNFMKGINIGTNDPNHASFPLLIHGEIEPPPGPPQATKETTDSGPA